MKKDTASERDPALALFTAASPLHEPAVVIPSGLFSVFPDADPSVARVSPLSICERRLCVVDVADLELACDLAPFDSRAVALSPASSYLTSKPLPVAKGVILGPESAPDVT